MLYSTHIFIGKEFDKVLAPIAKSLYHFDRETIAYNALYRVDVGQSSNLSFTRLKVETSEDTTLRLSGSDIVVTWSSEAAIDYTGLADYYRNTIFADMLRAGVAADSLHVYLHFPLYKSDTIKPMKAICEAIKSTSLPTEIDFIGYCDDMVSFIEPSYKIETPASGVIPSFVQMRESAGLNTTASHLLAIENKTVEGFPLIVRSTENNTPEEKQSIEEKAAKSFADMIAQLLYLLSAYYENIFPRTVESNDVTGIGFASLYFDKYLFANYLLQRAMLRTMDEEAVNQKEVDINKPIAVVNELLKNKETILSDFFKKYQGKESEAKYDEIKSELETLLDKVKSQFAGVKNMPDKVAVLAVLLSKSECELFASSVFDVNNRCYNDLYNEALNYFIEEDKVKFYCNSKDEEIVNPLNELREINRKAINSEAHIRELEKNLAELEKQIELNEKVQECYVDDSGFYNFGNNKFRLLPDIDEPPLAETYVAHEGLMPSVDLHAHFSSIKNQGQQGSCLSFTLTSIFEYMLRMSKAEECDLSEAFLYYNARNIDNVGDVDVTVDVGSRFHPAIESLSKFGIALEKFCPYNDNVYDQRPSDEAYADAEKRKLLKALGVNITLNDFKSALSDGYPIAASFLLFDSFSNAGLNGYVPVPTPEEMTKGLSPESDETVRRHGCHAMTIVGYSDELQMFLVRNSWGDDWGDNGYCYVPYGYVEQPGLVDFACIITEVDSIDKISPDLRQIPAMKIDNADLHIRYYIDLAALQLEQKNIAEFKAKRIQWLEYFELLKARYANANQRDMFIDKNVEQLEIEKSELQEKRKSAEIKQEEIKAEFTGEMRRKLIYAVIFAVACFLVFWGTNTILKKYVYKIVDEVTLAIDEGKEKVDDYIASAVEPFVGGDTIADTASKPVEKKVDVPAEKKKRFYLNYLWLIPIYLIYFIVLWIKSHRLWKDWREERDELDAIIYDCDKYIDNITSHVKQFRHKTFAAWQTIKSLSEVQLKFETLYSNYLSLLNNLRTWYEQIQDANEDVCVESSFPNVTILDKALLDNYFEKELSLTSICDVPLSENIEQHEVSGDYLSKYRADLQQLLFDRLIASLQDVNFNISAHVAEGRYLNMALPVTHEQFTTLDRQSNIFLQVNSTRRGIIPPHVEVFAPNTDLYANKLYLKMRPIEAQYVESEDKYRLMLVKTATYFYDECVALRPAKTKN